jgi:alpha-1,3-mannosyltransferase
MQQATLYEKGERTYTNIEGDTGPLVYPAGFLHLFSLLKSLTQGGTDILTAQFIFAALYIATQALTLASFIKSQTLPPWSLALVCLSRRVHSIYVLRLFNDCWAVFLTTAATLLLQSKKWRLSVLVYSAAVSIKMSALLVAPGVLAVLIRYATPYDLVEGVVGGVILQLLVALPFLMHDPVSYLSRAFELGRVFKYEWTVNWKFLPESVFVSKRMAVLLLIFHLRLLWSFAEYRWFLKVDNTESISNNNSGKISNVRTALQAFFTRSRKTNESKKEKEENGGGGGGDRGATTIVLWIVYSSNLIGIICARSLHYQFYSWYWHSLPFLLIGSKSLNSIGALMMLGGIEAVWNLFPPSALSSATLLVLHLLTLAIVWQSRQWIKMAIGGADEQSNGLKKKEVHSRSGKKAYLVTQ